MMNSTGCCGGGGTAAQAVCECTTTFRPDVDVIETSDEYQVKMDVPGATSEHLDIQFAEGELTVKAKVQARERDASARPVISEYGVGDFERRFRIGQGIDADAIRADLNAGVLTLHLPKAERTKARKIKVEA